MIVARVAAVVLLAFTAATNAPARLRVTVQVGADDASLHSETATLRCDGGHARGTGYLSAAGDAKAACRAVRAGRVGRVLKAQSSHRVCSMIYGGPQTARVTGTIKGSRVDLTVTRSDGCGVADWRRLQPLLGDPERT